MSARLRWLSLRLGGKLERENVALDKPSELKIALDNRTFEIQMFWQRSNYFLVLITAIGVAVFTLKDTFLAAVLSSFGAVSSYFWYKTNLGSKFWQESWEVEVVLLAKSEKIASFERSGKDIVRQVREAMDEGWKAGSKSWLQRYIDKEIAKKPSVSYYMILLSMVSTLVWAVVTSVLIIGLIKEGSSVFKPLDWLRELLIAVIALCFR